MVGEHDARVVRPESTDGGAQQFERTVQLPQPDIPQGTEQVHRMGVAE